MKVKLRLFGTLANLAVREQDISLPEGASVADLINSLVMQYGAEFRSRINRLEMWQVSVNGNCHILSESMKTILKDQNEVIIFPLQFGG